MDFETKKSEQKRGLKKEALLNLHKCIFFDSSKTDSSMYTN